MKALTISLSNNYTNQAAMNLTLNNGDFELLKNLVQKIEDGLYTDSENHLIIEGLSSNPIRLTISDYGESV
jgi:hypothetical protein